jgi:hypothetical protein
MGRFLGGSPPSSGDGARRGRRYEALPAANEEEVAVAASAAAGSRGAGVGEGSARHDSRSALMQSDSEQEEEEDAEQEQEAERRRRARAAEQEEKDDRQHDANNATVQEKATAKAEGKESPEQTGESDGEKTATEGDEEQEDAPLEDGAIHLRILDLNGKFFNITSRLDTTVAIVKAKVLECTEVPVAQQRLIYRGRVLEDEACLADYKVEDGHTVHLFVRAAPTPDPEILSAELNANGSTASGLRGEDGSGLMVVQMNGETVSSAVFPSDSARRVDPLMLDSPLGNCARRVKLWSSFLLIIYTMKVMGQFALLANDQQMRSQQNADGNESGNQPDRYDEYPQYYNPDPLVGGVEMLIHGFGVYVGCVGFKAAHDTDIRPIRFYFRGLIWLAILTLAEQVYITVQIANSDLPTERVQYPYGGQGPTKDDIVSANVFQIVMLVIMWLVAIRHSYQHVREVAIYNQSFAAAAMNAMPPVHLPEVV